MSAKIKKRSIHRICEHFLFSQQPVIWRKGNFSRCPSGTPHCQDKKQGSSRSWGYQ